MLTWSFFQTALRSDLWYKSWFKNLTPRLIYGEMRMILRSFVLTQYERVTDRQTDRHAAYVYVAL